MINQALYALFLSELDTAILCPYCGDENQLDPPLLCCGEVHAEQFYILGDDILEGIALQREYESWLDARSNSEPKRDEDIYFKID